MTVQDALDLAAVRLAGTEIPEPRREAAGLLAFTLGRSRTFLVAHPEYKLSTTEAHAFEKIVRRRFAREPYHYITGTREFYGLDFDLTPDVLIPRPETEILVESVLELLSKFAEPRFLEIGVGSGCISVSVLKHLPTASAIAVDISENAIDVARRNAEKHEVVSRMKLNVSNVYDQISGEQFNAILSNPPYIPATDIAGLQPEVRDYEPTTALTDGGDGLGIIRRILEGAPEHLLPGGFVIIEFGFGQSDSVLNMVDRDLWRSVVVIDDLQGIERTLVAELA